MPFQTGRILKIAGRVAGLGRQVRFDPGWDTRGSSTFDPRGHVLHHDAARVDILGIIRSGHGSLPGPLSNFYIPRDGTLWVVAAGRANHAGVGGWRGLSGNSSVYGTEVANDGLGEFYRPAQKATIDALHVALLEDVPLANCCSHHEWSPNRKTDIGDGPGRPWDMIRYRAAVARLTSELGGLSVADMEKIMGELGALRSQMTAVQNEVVKWDPETQSGLPSRMAWMLRDILTAVRPGTKIDRGVVTRLAPPLSPGSVSEEDIAQAVVAGVAMHLQLLAEKGVTVDHDKLAERLANEIGRRLAS